ncbi:MAG: PTS sugar transporter subunit IIA, partial [Niallia sp.]
ILKESDLKAIEKFILKQNNHQPIESFFLQDLVFLKKRFQIQEEVLTFLHAQLMEQGLVGNAFLDAVYEREKVAPTSYGNLVAIPHPITPQTEKTFLCVCTLEKPINWNNNTVQIVFLLCVKKNSQEDLQEMYDVLGKFIEDHTSVHKILKANTYEEFMRIMKEA